MLWKQYVSVAVLILSGASAAANPARHAVGFVELAGIPGYSDSREAPRRSQRKASAAIPLYEAPAELSRAIAQITSRDTVVATELDDEEQAALVYDTSHGWFLLRIRDGGTERAGWLSPADARTYYPLEERVRDGLSYLTAAWNRQLYDKPRGKPSPVQLPAGAHQEPDIRVADIRGSGKEAWLLVELLEPGRCGSNEEPRVITRGWVPLHAADGHPNVWFYPRGC